MQGETSWRENIVDCLHVACWLASHRIFPSVTGAASPVLSVCCQWLSGVGQRAVAASPSHRPSRSRSSRACHALRDAGCPACALAVLRRSFDQEHEEQEQICSLQVSRSKSTARYTQAKTSIVYIPKLNICLFNWYYSYFLIANLLWPSCKFLIPFVC